MESDGDNLARHSSGWIKLYRSAIDSDLSQNINLWCLWMWLLCSASWKESSILWRGQRRDIPPGTVVCGISEIALRWEISKKTVLRWLDYLEQSQRIRIEKSPRGTLVTILNWATYQSTEDNGVTLTTHSGNTEVTPTSRSGNTDFTLSHPYEESKKVRIKKVRREEVTPHPLLEIWNSNSGSLPKAKGMSATRRKSADARWQENPSTEYWAEIVTRLARSSFCNGSNDRGWKADFDFLIQPETQNKALEGKYDDRPHGVISGSAVDPRIQKLREQTDAEFAELERQWS